MARLLVAAWCVPPLLLYSGLIESEQIDWLSSQPHQEYLASPFSYYQIKQPAVLLPSQFESVAAKRYFEQTVKPQLAAAEGFLLVALQMRHNYPDSSLRYVHQYLKQTIEKHGFIATEIKGSGLVKLFRFRRAVESDSQK